MTYCLLQMDINMLRDIQWTISQYITNNIIFLGSNPFFPRELYFQFHLSDITLLIDIFLEISIDFIHKCKIEINTYYFDLLWKKIDQIYDIFLKWTWKILFKIGTIISKFSTPKQALFPLLFCFTNYLLEHVKKD